MHGIIPNFPGCWSCLAFKHCWKLQLGSTALCRLRDVLWDHTQLYLIMDYVEQDLRQFMDNNPQSRSLSTVKVPCPFSTSIVRQAGDLFHSRGTT